MNTHAAYTSTILSRQRIYPVYHRSLKRPGSYRADLRTGDFCGTCTSSARMAAEATWVDYSVATEVFFKVSRKARGRRRPFRGVRQAGLSRTNNIDRLGNGVAWARWAGCVSTYVHTHDKHVSTSRRHSTGPCPLQIPLQPHKWPATEDWGVCSGNGCIHYEFTIPQPPRCKVSTRACRRHGPYRLLILHYPS